MKSLFKIIKIIILVIILIAIFFCGYFIYDGYKLYKSAIETQSIEEKIEYIRNKDNYIKYDEIPEDYLNAVISVEDKRFKEHFGIDIYSIGRALISNFEKKKIVGGGSTITQQLAKNMYFEQKKKLTRKVAEAFVALNLEEDYTKEDIIELYVNIIYYGDGYYGLRDATQGYFGKDINELNLNEMTLLAGIPNAPSVYQLSNDSDYTYQRQIVVIKAMENEGYLSKDDAETLIENIKDIRGI